MIRTAHFLETLAPLVTLVGLDPARDARARQAFEVELAPQLAPCRVLYWMAPGGLYLATNGAAGVHWFRFEPAGVA